MLSENDEIYVEYYSGYQYNEKILFIYKKIINDEGLILYFDNSVRMSDYSIYKDKLPFIESRQRDWPTKKITLDKYIALKLTL